MKIGFVLSSAPNYSESFIYNKINGLINYGFNVSLFVADRTNNKFVPKHIPVYYQVAINNKIHLFITVIAAIILHPVICLRFLKLERLSNVNWIDAFKHLILNSHFIGKSLDWIHFGFTTTALGRENLASAMGIEAAVSFRGFDIGLYPHQHLGCYDLLWKRIDKVHTISDDLYKQAIDLGLPPKIPYKKITPAINTEFFQSNSFKDLHEPLRILTVGRLTWKKGYEYALKALSLLKDKQINFEYHIVGEGNYREAIVFAIHQLQLTENVKFIGKIPPDEVRNEMRWADIYIQPSIQEGFCNAVLEAQAMGLLCIVTDAEGLSENVLHAKTGWVVNKRKPKLIAEIIQQIIHMDNAKLRLISEFAKNRIQNEFSLSKQTELFSKFYCFK